MLLESICRTRLHDGTNASVRIKEVLPNQHMVSYRRDGWPVWKWEWVTPQESIFFPSLSESLYAAERVMNAGAQVAPAAGRTNENV